MHARTSSTHVRQTVPNTASLKISEGGGGELETKYKKK